VDHDGEVLRVADQSPGRRAPDVAGAFVLSSDRMLQQFGLGLAVAILLDAVVIRCLIVPAVMQMLGKWA
jgi:hypothetical protein